MPWLFLGDVLGKHRHICIEVGLQVPSPSSVASSGGGSCLGTKGWWPHPVLGITASHQQSASPSLSLMEKLQRNLVLGSTRRTGGPWKIQQDMRHLNGGSAFLCDAKVGPEGRLQPGWDGW